MDTECPVPLVTEEDGEVENCFSCLLGGETLTRWDGRKVGGREG